MQRLSRAILSFCHLKRCRVLVAMLKYRRSHPLVNSSLHADIRHATPRHTVCSICKGIAFLLHYIWCRIRARHCCYCCASCCIELGLVDLFRGGPDADSWRRERIWTTSMWHLPSWSGRGMVLRSNSVVVDPPPDRLPHFARNSGRLLRVKDVSSRFRADALYVSSRQHDFSTA